jgi:TPR repeat protein
MVQRILLLTILLTNIFALDIDLVRKAKAGDPDALYEYGMIKYNKKIYKEALCCFEKAATKEHVNAQYYVGYMNHRGLGTDVNIKDAAYWYIRTLRKHHLDAMYELATIYQKEVGFIDQKKASAYLYKAKMLGHALAAEAYAQLEVKAKEDASVKAQIRKIVADSTQVSDKDLQMAEKEYKLGLLYYSGETISKDLKKSLEYFKEAARLGSQKAQFRLGYMFLSGIEVEKDLKLAYIYLDETSRGPNKTIAEKSLELITAYELDQ